jgi:multiple sugar transport system substrate-binding protein
MSHRRYFFWNFWILLALLVSCIPVTEAPLEISATETPSAAAFTPTPTRIPPPTPTPRLQENALSGIQIEIWHPLYGASESLLNLQIESFNNENPWGILVHAESYGNYTRLFQNVNDALAAEKDLPDLVLALPSELLVWNDAGHILDITPYLDDPDIGFSEEVLADIPAIFLEQDEVDGKRLGIPAQRSARFLLYNATWGKELGYLAPPSSATDFEEQACAANQSLREDENPENDGKGGWILDFDSDTILSWMYAFGGGPVQNGGYRFLIPENMSALKSLKTLYDDHCAWLSSEETPYEQFAERSALFATASLEEFPEVQRAFDRAENADEWIPIPFPGPIEQKFAVTGASFAILPSDEAHQLAAWLFIRWMLSPENQARWVETTGLFPLRMTSLNDLISYRDSHPQWNEALALLPKGEIEPRLPSWRKARYLLGDGVEHIFRTNMDAGTIPAVLAEMNSMAVEFEHQIGESP